MSLRCLIGLHSKGPWVLHVSDLGCEWVTLLQRCTKCKQVIAERTVHHTRTL